MIGVLYAVLVHMTTAPGTGISAVYWGSVSRAVNDSTSVALVYSLALAHRQDGFTQKYSYNKSSSFNYDFL